MRLLPKGTEYTWAPFTALYFGFFFIDPIVSRAGLRVWSWTILGTVAFLLLYFGMFWVSRRQAILHVAAMVLLGVVYARYNGGATTFFIFATASAPFILKTEADGFKALAGVEATVLLTWWGFHLNGWFLFFAGGLSLVIGLSNIHFAQRNRTQKQLIRAQEEIEHLAKVAERERIARDLHDVLGHTLSVITLKSELAGKLMERDPQRAGKEIGEVEEISRQALADVRDAIRGYRAQGLAAELERAKSTLETAGLTVQCDSAATLQLPAMQESVLALAVREAVTNVVRHARASSCQLRLEQQNGSCRLEIRDDGVGCASLEGNGLRGMRERVEMLGGTLDRIAKSGTTLTITLPLTDGATSNGKQGGQP
ncbi:MAG TPA: sensor histidine kinase [Candidatus Sulfotelmatobacter sp.]|nr:sensor histidine kinase [Candidatus Sulfotelmatobacter sp.]